MRISTSWHRTAVAGLILLASCVTGDHTSGPDTPRSADVTSPPTAATSAGTILLQESFEDNGFASRGWYDNTSMATTTAQHLPGSTRALEVHFTPGATTPTWGGSARHLFPATPTLHISYWVKYSDNWVGSGRPYHPHEFLVMSDMDGDYDGPSIAWMVTNVDHNYQNGGIPHMVVQDSKAINTSFGTPPINLVGVTEDRSTSGCNGVVEPNVSTSCFTYPPWYNAKEVIANQVQFQPNPGPGYKGNWNHVEAYFQLNSVVGGIGLADGVMQYWFNGAPVIDRHDILFRTGARPTIQFHQFLIAPYIGDGSPVDQYMWVDDLTLATSRTTGIASVASVNVSPSSTSVAAGGTQQLTATLADSSGNTLTGRVVTWASSTSTVATVSGSGLVTALAAGTTTITATSEGVQGTAAVTVTPSTTPTKPGTVADLSVSGVSNNGVTLAFTEVTDGSGLPASYFVRFDEAPIAWGSASDAAQGTCKVPMAGTVIGATRSCTVTGLAAQTSYQFQLVAFRGSLTGTAVFGGLSNVAAGTTTGGTPPPPPPPPPPPAPVASVTVSPASASLVVGAVQQLTATPRDASGNALTGRVVTWGSSNTTVATVSASGLVTARAAGAATITATSEGQSGTAVVTVTIQPPPPPPPPGGTWPNEPAGFTVINDFGWNAVNSGGWLSNGGITIVADATAPLSPSSVAEFKYPAGFTSAGVAPGTTYISVGGQRVMYVGYWWKASNPWQGHDSGINKLMFLVSNDFSNDVIMSMRGGVSGPFKLDTYVNGTYLGANVNNPNVALGVWHRIELYVNANTGVVRWWMDGQLLGDRSGVGFASNAFSEFQFSPTWGGAGGTNKQETDYYWYDHVHLSRQ